MQWRWRGRANLLQFTNHKKKIFFNCCASYPCLTKSRTFSRIEVANHASEDDCWIIIGDNVVDVSTFLDEHPGGLDLLLEHAGKDATDDFRVVHGTNEHVIKRMLNLIVGKLQD